MILRVLLRSFGKLQRPLAWVAFVYGFVTLVGTVAHLIAVREPRFTAIGVAVLVFLEGFAAARDVENELDSEGAADDGDETSHYDPGSEWPVDIVELDVPGGGIIRAPRRLVGQIFWMSIPEGERVALQVHRDRMAGGEQS